MEYNNIPFIDFIRVFCFRYARRLENGSYEDDTDIIRIYLPDCDNGNSEWFEFGIYDYDRDTSVLERIKRIFSKEILNSYVSTVCLDQETNTVRVYLTKNKKYLD